MQEMPTPELPSETCGIFGAEIVQIFFYHIWYTGNLQIDTMFAYFTDTSC